MNEDAAGAGRKDLDVPEEKLSGQNMASGASPDGEGNDGVQASNWRDAITDEKARKFAERFTDPSDAAKAAFEFRQKLSSAVTKPGKNASPEDIADFNRKMGVPGKPEEYVFEMWEGREATDAEKNLHRGMAEILHKADINADQAKRLNSGWNDLAHAQLKVIEKAEIESWQASRAELKNEWGENYKSNIKVAELALDKFGGEGFTELLQNTRAGGKRLGSHPELIKVFAAIGRHMIEDGFQMTDATASPVADINASRKDLTERIHLAQHRGESALATKLIEERSKLTEQMVG